MAVRFDAANDRYTASTGLPTGNTWTVTSWIYISVDRNTYSTWLSIDDANASGTARFALLNTVSNGTTLALDTQGSSVGNYAGAVGTWYRYGASVSSGAVTLYIGTAAGSLTTYTGSPGNFPTAPVRLWIGNEPIFGDFFNGRVAAVKIWNAALSAVEVEAELAQYAAVRTADLIRSHPFIDSPADESGNGHTLTAGTSAVTWEAGPDIPLGGGTTGALSGTLAAPTSTATGQVTTTGAVAGTAPAPASTAAGTVRATGQITTTGPAATGALTGATRTTGALAGALPAATGTATGTTATTGAVAGTGAAPTAEFAGTVTTPGTLAGAGPAPTGDVTGTVTTTGTVDTDAPAPTGELVGHVTTTGTLAASGPAPTAALTGLVGDNRLTGTLPAPVGEFTGTTSTTAVLAGTLPAPVGEFTASNDVTGQLTGTLPPPTATATGAATVTGQLAGTLPTPEFTAGVQVERDISLVANLAPAAWHTVLDDTEWRVLLAATDWAGALQALAWLAGVDEPGWAVSDLVADQWASTLHAEQWAAVAAVAEWAVSTPWITTPGEAGPGMRLNSKEFVKVTVTPSKDPATGTPLDISADLVEMCVTLATHPEELDWQPAAWVGTADVTTGAIACRLLVQPSALGLAANSQPAVFVRVHDNPEIPVLKAGQLSIN